MSDPVAGSADDLAGGLDGEVERERRRAELRHGERMAIVASLLAGVAHELNNPLAVLLGQAGMLRRSTDDPALLARIEKIVAAAERCSHVVSTFLAFARERQPELARVDLARAVAQALDLVGYALRSSGVEVEVRVPVDLPPLHVDPHQLQYVLVALVSNAEVALRDRPERRLTVSVERQHDAGRLRLMVADTGPGIAPGRRAHLFEPGSTTQPYREGGGLGLLLCREIVEQHRGRIFLLEPEAPGARFCVELPFEPWATAGGEERSDEVGAPVAASAPLTVLIADDEPVLCELLAEELAALGHTAVVAASGREALTRLAERTFDVVLCDVRMPDLDGMALYREVVGSQPGSASSFVFMTGDTLREETRRQLRESGVATLAKPFTVTALREALAEVRRSTRALRAGHP